MKATNWKRLVLVAGVFFGGCGASDPTALSPDAGVALEASMPGADGANADGALPITLPADESPHNSKIEWWYYTGQLTGAGEGGTQRYGFEAVIFQVIKSGIKAYIGHFAVTDTNQGAFNHASKVVFTGQPPADAGFALEVDTLVSLKGHAGNDRIAANMPGYSLDLTLVANKPVVLQYGDGAMALGSDSPFYYYSYTNMGVSGTLTVGNISLPVSGKAWMDHQWGEMGNFDGWDWYSLRFDDQTEIMLFVVRNSSGTGFVGGTLVREDGSYQALGAGDFTVQPAGEWSSPHLNGTYPQGWVINVPAIDLTATVSPVMPDQEFYKGTELHETSYWEGLCNLSGVRNGADVAGYAYVELTGYAHAP